MKKLANSDSEDSRVKRDFSTLARDIANHLLILSNFLRTKKSISQEDIRLTTGHKRDMTLTCDHAHQ